MLSKIFKNKIVNIHEYLWISVDIKKIYEYRTHVTNIRTDMETGTKEIFIQYVKYERVTDRTYPLR